MDIYLDANATTPVLPQARAAALAVMAETFGNPSSVHGSGLRARALLERVRTSARRVLGVATGQMLFTSGATEGIQTAVLSALVELRARRDADARTPTLLLYGATEHKAVPAALKHWNQLLGLGLSILPIPVRRDGRHDLAWLAEHAPAPGWSAPWPQTTRPACSATWTASRPPSARAMPCGWWTACRRWASWT